MRKKHLQIIRQLRMDHFLMLKKVRDNHCGAIQIYDTTGGLVETTEKNKCEYQGWKNYDTQPPKTYGGSRIEKL